MPQPTPPNSSSGTPAPASSPESNGSKSKDLAELVSWFRSDVVSDLPLPLHVLIIK
jgi:hypothetical protein